ncbi:MAG: hypothetical protein CSB49_08235 [Proteobacteria bacterium]|nr:MAG: hypothetical protein CSB49_08235 [Pseudomonadota bacterium]
MKRRLPLLLALLVIVAVAFYLIVLRGSGPDPKARAERHEKNSTRRRVNRGRDRKLLSPGAKGSAGGASLAATIQQGKRLINGTWGAGRGQFGKLKARESNPEGPMSFAVGKKGTLLVLDQVNRRLQRYGPDGRLLSTQRIATETAQDVILDSNGNALVLDRLGKDPTIHVYDASGDAKGAIPFTGEQVGEPGGVSGVFADGDGVYVEVEHDKLVRVADGNGNPVSTRDTVPGRPTRDGRLYIKAGILDKATGRVYVQAHDKAQKLAWETALNLGGAVVHILLLDSDLTGNVYLGAEVEETPEPQATYKTVVARLEGQQGKLNGQLLLPPTTTEPTESFKPLSVGDDGTVYHLVHTASGPTLTAYTFE